jgi:hypothetical protein
MPQYNIPELIQSVFIKLNTLIQNYVNKWLRQVGCFLRLLTATILWKSLKWR